jgi:ATP-dependent DNA ligase
VPYLHQVEVFKDGEVLFDYCNRFGFEGVVSKRRQSGYASGSSRWWVNVKCPQWKRANSERWRCSRSLTLASACAGRCANAI